MAKPPSPRQQATPEAKLRDKAADLATDFDRALTRGKKSARSRITEELRRLVEQDPESFARGLKRLINDDQ
jgi:flagellar biosynthesis/type III secretory pathway M-ring protein FliF/YscJ